MELVHPVNLDGVCTGAAHVGPHGVEEVCQVNNMGFSGGIFYDGSAGSQDGCQNDIHRCPDRHFVQIHLGSVQPAVTRCCIHEAVLHCDIRSKRFHPLDMLVNRPFTEVAAAGHCRLRNTEAAQHGPDEIIGRADFSHQIKRGIMERDIGAVDFHCGIADKPDLRTECGNDGKEHIRVTDMRHIFNTADALHQQGGRNHCNSSVLRTADFNFSL